MERMDVMGVVFPGQMKSVMPQPKIDMKSAKDLQSFIHYCEAHPDERFWQALRNWAEVSYIYTQTEHSPIKNTYYKK